MAAKREKPQASAPVTAADKVAKALQKDGGATSTGFVPRVRKMLRKARLIMDD